jgi:hypothetical protein
LASRGDESGRRDIRLEASETRFALARALWDAGGDRTRARHLAAAARADYERTPSPSRKGAEIAAWLSTHADT